MLAIVFFFVLLIFFIIVIIVIISFYISLRSTFVLSCFSTFYIRILRPYGRAADPGRSGGTENHPKMGVIMTDFQTNLEPKVTQSR